MSNKAINNNVKGSKKEVKKNNVESDKKKYTPKSNSDDSDDSDDSDVSDVSDILDDSEDESVESSEEDNSEDELENADKDDQENNEVKDESDEESENKDKTTEKKEKPKKLTHDELLLEINKLLEGETILENEISELEKILVTKNKLRSIYRRNKTKLIGLLSKAYQDGLNKARKEKKKRTNNSKSGILAEHPVPPILQQFLGLSEDTLLMRPKVFSLLNNKFKELELKKGQETILDKKTAKLFGMEEGHVIRFQDCQKFLANIYDKANSKVTEVTL
jgi:hypothetical protein